MPPSPPRLLSLATAVPAYRLDQRDVVQRAAQLFNGAFFDLDRLLNVYKNAAIETRYSCVPIDWYMHE